jgi:hypothetical protein
MMHRGARVAVWLALFSSPVLPGLWLSAARADVLQYGDGQADGKRSFGGGGHLVLFDAGREGRWLNKVEMFGSRYGTAQPPDEDFHLYIVALDGIILHKVSLPYLLWERGTEYWRELPIPPIQVPRQFGIGLTFNAQQTKGVYVGTDAVMESHSYSWTPDSEARGMWDVDWMIRAEVDDQAVGDPQARDLIILRDTTAFFDALPAAQGDPLVLQTAEHGDLPRDAVASVRLNAIVSPLPTSAVIMLTGGLTIRGTIVSLDDQMVRVRDETGAQREFQRSEVARVDFEESVPQPIGPQTPPEQPKRGWGPEQAIGAPDTPEAGDRQTAWAPGQQDGGPEWLRLDYANPVAIAQVRIREAYNPGAVWRVCALLDDGTEVLLWEGEDTTTTAPADFVVDVDGAVVGRCIKVYLDTARTPGWNEIDAVELVGRDGSRQWAIRASASSSYADR